MTLFRNTFKNVWFTRAVFHEKSTKYYGVIEKKGRRGKINNSLTLLPRLPEGVNKHFLDSFTLDVLPRQNNRNFCEFSLSSSLTDSNTMISNNISLLKHATAAGRVIIALFSFARKSCDLKIFLQ